MNRTLILVVLILILLFLIYYAFNTPVQNIPQVPVNTSQTQNVSTSPASTATSSFATSSPKELDISIQNYSFNPTIANVKVGSLVVWVNNDTVAHTVDGGTVFRSSILQPGDTFSYTFMSPGSFTYICSLHPNMKGSIIVEQ